MLPSASAIVTRLLLLPRPVKRRLQAFADFALIALSVYLAYVLRLESWAPREPAHMAIAATVAAAAAVATFEKMGLYRALVRYAGSAQLEPILAGLVSAIVTLAIAGWILELFVPRTVPLLFALVGLTLIGGLRLLLRRMLQRFGSAAARRVAIYGAGSAGRQLALALLSTSDYAPVIFVDDDDSLRGSSVMGLPIFDPSALAELVARYEIDRVLLAVPSAGPKRRREIIARLSKLPVSVLTVPSVKDIVSGRLSVSALREVSPGDLLGRVPIPPSTELIGADIRGRVVMVTGAGGSIGSELCRLAVMNGSRELVLYENSEFALYSIDAELAILNRQRSEPCIIHAVLGSIRDQRKLESAVRDHAVETIYHAAAYKHVPLVEGNPFEGILNNSFGTALVAQVAERLQVKSFVLVSTDKAVRPTSVMGASKRLAELICQDLGQRSATTCFSMVRFGNVLDSSGSVVPLFRGQIRNGGPVTVTHPEVTRYFMTIREAAELVIQAGAMAKGGEVFVLDMGTPIRIADLARSMILLSGHSVRDDSNPDGDIEIAYTGLRPGEKLYEELVIGTNVQPTAHPRISASQEAFLSQTELAENLMVLEAIVLTQNRARLDELLHCLPLGYGAMDRHQSEYCRQAT